MVHTIPQRPRRSADAIPTPRLLVEALRVVGLLTLFTSVAAFPSTGTVDLAAQTPVARQALTGSDYARAERRLGSFAQPLVRNTSVSPEWLGDGRFYYERSVEGGSEFILVDPDEGRRGPAFDHVLLAETLSQMSPGQRVAPTELPFRRFELTANDRTITFRVEERSYSCDIGSVVYRCETVGRSPTATPPVQSGRGVAGRGGRAESISPDGTKAAFIRDHDLWIRDLDSGSERPLTTDGVEDFGYATDNAGWTRSDRPVVSWSPDSRRIATFRHDARGVGMMYLTRTEVGHPTLEAWRYPLPEDTVIFRITRVVLDTEAPAGREMVTLGIPPDQHRSTVCDHVFCGGTFADNEWSQDGATLLFVSSSRDHKRALVRRADTGTGEVTDLFEEVEETFYESGGNWRYLSDSEEVLWFSQRDDWGHLYLYDARTGAQKRQLTSGSWNVLDIRRVDAERRKVYVTGGGREPGDPYFQYFYEVDLDDGDVTLLTPDSAHHRITLSPDGEYFVDSYSTPTTAPVTTLRSIDGDEVMVLEEADISELLETGWQAPIPFSVKARDGVTDVYGLMFRPYDFDPSESYPVVNYLYPGPQSGSVGSRSFSAARRDHDAMAELGFVVITLDAMGTPGRSKSFHETYYGNMGDNGLPDQIAAIRQLADRHAWIDLDRVGIYGHSGGGFAAADGILRYPDFYKVAVSQAGNHDNRNYEDDWGEKWQGLLEVYPDGSTNYDNQANQLLADNLKGKLLLAHGTLDSNVPPSNTLLVVDALIEANKDFDLILFPNRRHGFGNEPYMMRRRWDYFVEHLMGAEPPAEFAFGERRGPVS